MNVISPEIGASNSQSRLLASRLAITYIGWMMTTMDYSQRSRSHSNAKALSTLQKLCCILQNTQTFFSSSQPLLADIFISKTKNGKSTEKISFTSVPPFSPRLLPFAVKLDITQQLGVHWVSAQTQLWLGRGGQILASGSTFKVYKYSCQV